MSSVRKQATIATLAVSGSRVAGLVREVVFAFFFGASATLDAFIAAFRIPNLLRDLFSEGALSTAFVSVFSKKLAKEGDGPAWKLANLVLTFVLLLIGTLTILGIIYSPAIVHTVASGFTGAKLEYTIYLNRLLFPFILFVSLAAVVMGMLNAKGKFALPQSASTFFNLTSIVTGLLFAFWFSPSFIKQSFASLWESASFQPDWFSVTKAMTGMAVGTLLGGLVQWLVQMPALHRMGYRPRFSIDTRDPGFRQVLALTGPAVIGGAAVQVNVLINTNFASFLVDGSISWLNYAFRLMQFPIGVFGVAIALATAPVVARMVAEKKEGDLKQTIRESLQMTFYLCLPSALGLIVLADPIISLIYQYGQFTAIDTVQTSRALMAYATGLVFYAMVKVLQPVFLGFDDAKTPMVLSLVSIAVNAAINGWLVFGMNFSHWGLALGTSFVACWNGILLSTFLHKKLKGIWTREMVTHLLKISVSAILACLAAWAAYRELLFLIGRDHIGDKLLLVFVPIGLAALCYFFFTSRLHVEEAKVLKEWIGRKIKR